MSKNLFYYRINSKGEPLVGSNNKVNKTIPKGRIMYFTPQYLICCGEEITEEATNKKIKYFVKLDSQNIPISGSLIKRRIKPVGRWQEVFKQCCTRSLLDFSTLNDLLGSINGLLLPISEDGTDIPVGQFWVTQEATDDLMIVVTEATNLLKEDNLTQSIIDDMVTELTDAIEAYEDSKEEGTQSV